MKSQLQTGASLWGDKESNENAVFCPKILDQWPKIIFFQKSLLGILRPTSGGNMKFLVLKVAEKRRITKKHFFAPKSVTRDPKNF
jgi:hypothetical protein